MFDVWFCIIFRGKGKVGYDHILRVFLSFLFFTKNSTSYAFFLDELQRFMTLLTSDDGCSVMNIIMQISTVMSDAIMWTSKVNTEAGTTSEP